MGRVDENLGNKPYHPVHPHADNRIGHLRYDMNFVFKEQRALWVQEIQSDLLKLIKAWCAPKEERQPSGPFSQGKDFGATDLDTEQPPEEPYIPQAPPEVELANPESLREKIDIAIEGNNKYKEIVDDFLTRFREDTSARFTQSVGSHDPQNRPEATNPSDYRVELESFSIHHNEGHTPETLNQGVEQAVDNPEVKAQLVGQLEQQSNEYTVVNEIISKIKDEIGTYQERATIEQEEQVRAHEEEMAGYEEQNRKYEEDLAEYETRQSDKEGEKERLRQIGQGFKTWATDFTKNWHVFALKKVLLQAKKKGCKYFCLTGRDYTGFDSGSAPFKRRGGDVETNDEGKPIPTSQYKEYYVELAKKMNMKNSDIEPSDDDAKLDFKDPEEYKREMGVEMGSDEDEDRCTYCNRSHDDCQCELCGDCGERIEDCDCPHCDNCGETPSQCRCETFGESLILERFQPEGISEVRFWWLPIDKAITAVAGVHESKLFLSQNKDVVKNVLTELREKLK